MRDNLTREWLEDTAKISLFWNRGRAVFIHTCKNGKSNVLMPHRIKKSGKYSKEREYEFIQVRIGNKIHSLMCSRVVYALAHGTCEKNCVILFKDGNTENYKVKNLVAISKEELAEKIFG